MEFKNMNSLKSYGITRCEDLDFRDDGNKFKGYMYKGFEGELPITYLHSGDYYYISLRVDYLDELNYSDYHNQAWYKLTDEFNGVSEVDGDKLIQNCKAVLFGYNYLKENLPVVDSNKIDEMISIGNKEIEYAEDVMIKFKEKFNCFDRNFSSYELKNYIESVKSLEDEISYLKDKLNELHNTNQVELRYLVDKYQRTGYIFLHKDQYDLQRLNSYLNKEEEAC